jgi:monothiol glutaredoxin
VFIDGEFVGGCDIVIDLHKSGELADLLVESGVKKSGEQN